MKITNRQITGMAIVLYLLYAFFSDLIGVLFSASIYRYGLWGLSVLLLIFATKSYKSFKLSRGLFAAVVVSMAFVLIRNQAFAHHDYMTTIRWLFCFIFALLLMKKPESYNQVLESLIKIGFIHVTATYIFWLMPSLYNRMFKLWGYWPSGTSSGRLGYKASLTNNYSRNGIMLAVTYLAVFSIILAMSGGIKSVRNKRHLRFFKFLFALAVFATLLTTKRAHLIFGMAAVFTVYFFCNPEKVGNKTFKLTLIGIVGVAGLIIASQYVPAVSTFFDRFSSVEEDSTLQSRFTFWILAIQMFTQSPLLGKGWFAFRYQYRLNLYNTSIRSARYDLLDCHNVYIQLLAETGIVGLIFYLIIVVYVLTLTFHLLRHSRSEIEQSNLYAPLVFSALMQIFYLLYSLTGNCLYDITSAFYFLAVAITMGSYFTIRKTRLKGHEINE